MLLPPRILYADNDPIDAQMMSHWLTDSFGFDVTTAHDGKQASEMIECESFDLFLLDYCFPDTTAVQICAKIRAVDPFVPILIYSTLNRDVDKQQGIAAGANDYLVKPDQMNLLKPHIDALLGRKLVNRFSSAPRENINLTRVPRNRLAMRLRASRIV